MRRGHPSPSRTSRRKSRTQRSLATRSAAEESSEGATHIPDGVEMIFWENWGSDRSRLTIWADGRSEIVVDTGDGPIALIPSTINTGNNVVAAKSKPGWTVVSGEAGAAVFRKSNPYSKSRASAMFHAALAAGFCQLKEFQQGYDDGGSTTIGMQIKGVLTTRNIPNFLPSDIRLMPLNYRRYCDVEKILGGFDSDAEAYPDEPTPLAPPQRPAPSPSSERKSAN